MRSKGFSLAGLLLAGVMGLIGVYDLATRFSASASDEMRAAHNRHILMAGVLTLLIFILFLLTRRAFISLVQDLQKKERHIGTLENRRSADRDSAELLVRINDLTEVFGETHDLKAVLTEAAKVLEEVLKVNTLILQLYSHEESRFFHRIEVPEGSDIDLGEEVKDDVIEAGRSRLINALETMPAYAHLAKLGFRSVIVTPITRISRGGVKEAIGMIAALTSERRDFTSHEFSLLTSFSKQAGLIIENAHLYEKTEHMAMHDGLTNLLNQRRFKELLDNEIEKARRESSSLCLLLGDIDFFKNFNDTHGHEQGNEVLRGVADILIRNTRGADIVARYGGEEFVVILPSTDLDGARRVGDNLVTRVRESTFAGEDQQPAGLLTITFGLAVFPDDGEDAARLIEAADQAMYEGKSTGKDRLIVYKDMAADRKS